METTPLQIGDDCRQRVRSAANADMHENDGAVEVAVALAGDAIDQKLGSLYWFDSVLAIERPVDRSVTEIPRDFQNPLDRVCRRERGISASAFDQKPEQWRARPA